MSPRRETEAEDPGQVQGHPHPRDIFELIGQDQALTLAARAVRSGHLPQAYILGGPPGIGKATLAYRIARYVLRHGATAAGPADLAVPGGDSVSRQIAAQSHPNLLVLRRRANERGKLKTVLDVEEVRRLGGFFSLTAGAGGWRVAIIDSADEMNDNAANALLKILEEPPPFGLLLLISHAPGRLLPTIRSRAQRLEMKPLGDAVLSRALETRLPEVSTEDRAHLVALAQGSLGLALRLASEEGLALARDADSLLQPSGTLDYPRLFALAERVVRVTGGLEQFKTFLVQSLGRHILARARAGEGDERAVALREQIAALYERAIELHLEPRQTVLSSAADIAAARRAKALYIGP